MALLVYRVVAWQALQTGRSLFTLNALRVNELLTIFAYIILVEVALYTPFWWEYECTYKDHNNAEKETNGSHTLEVVKAGLGFEDRALLKISASDPAHLKP